jgi:hypothetical protein
VALATVWMHKRIEVPFRIRLRALLDARCSTTART